MMYSFDLTIDSRCAKIPWSKGPRKLCAFIYVLQCTVQLLSYLVDECIGFKFWCEQNTPHMARAISFIKNTFVCLFDVGYRLQVHLTCQKTMCIHVCPAFYGSVDSKAVLGLIWFEQNTPHIANYFIH